MYYQTTSPVSARVRSPGPLRSPRRSASSWTGTSPRGEIAHSSLLRRRTASGSTSPEALLSKSYETIVSDINLHRPIGPSGGTRRSFSPVAAGTTGRFRSPRSPHRSVYASRSPRARSPRVPSASFYRPVGSPVARTIFPTRRAASTSPSPGTLSISAPLVALHSC
jgi:hypothetical protein